MFPMLGRLRAVVNSTATVDCINYTVRSIPHSDTVRYSGCGRANDSWDDQQLGGSPIAIFRSRPALPPGPSHR